jgi:hypothetical protein
LVFHVYINEMHCSRSKIPSKNLVHMYATLVGHGLNTLPVLHFNRCLTAEYSETTATSVLTTESTYRSLSAQRLSENTIFVPKPRKLYVVESGGLCLSAIFPRNLCSFVRPCVSLVDTTPCRVCVVKFSLRRSHSSLVLNFVPQNSIWR